MQYQRKPEIIEAQQFHGGETHPQLSYPYYSGVCGTCQQDMVLHGWVTTPQGGHVVCPEDWIIKEATGSSYACKPDVFEATYIPVE